MDLAEFTSDYMRIFKNNGTRPPARAELVKEISLAAAENDYESTGEMTDKEFAAYAATLEPQVDYYLS